MPERHEFVGRHDRWCEVCNRPDRDPIHRTRRDQEFDGPKPENRASPATPAESQEARRIADDILRGVNPAAYGETSVKKLARAHKALLTEQDELREAIIEARRYLWWFIERDIGDGTWGFAESDVEQVATQAMYVQDEILGKALGFSPVPVEAEAPEIGVVEAILSGDKAENVVYEEAPERGER